MEETTDRQEAKSQGRTRRRRCDNCNARLRGRFCIRCGQRDLEYDRVVCDNCGAEKWGHYCAVCGQNDRNYRRNVFPVIGEVLSESFEFDSRLVKTLPKLLLRPGFLSLEFSRNRRASYLSPIRLYLFTSIVFFFVLSLSIDLPEGPGLGRDAAQTREGTTPTTFDRTEDDEPWLAISFGEDGDEGENGVESADGDEPADERRAERQPQPNPASGALAQQQQEAFDRLAPVLNEQQRRKLLEILRRSALSEAVVEGARSLTAGATADITASQRYVVGQLIDILHQPLDAVRTWIENLPVAMFCLLPLFALLLMLCYRNRRLFYTEHLVFAMHNHTVAFLAFTVLMLLPEDNAVAGLSAQLLLLALPVYYFIAMRHFYGGRRFATATRMLLLLNLYGFLLFAALAAAAAAVFLLF